MARMSLDIAILVQYKAHLSIAQRLFFGTAPIGMVPPSSSIPLGDLPRVHNLARIVDSNWQTRGMNVVMSHPSAVPTPSQPSASALSVPFHQLSPHDLETPVMSSIFHILTPWRTGDILSICAKLSLGAQHVPPQIGSTLVYRPLEIMTNISRYSPKRSFIICMNCAGALVTPKGITKYSNKPQRVLNAVFRNVL